MSEAWLADLTTVMPGRTSEYTPSSFHVAFLYHMDSVFIDEQKHLT
jgi:hypothetical protein